MSDYRLEKASAQLRDYLMSGPVSEMNIQPRSVDKVQVGLDAIEDRLRDAALLLEATEQSYQGIRQRLEQLAEDLENGIEVVPGVTVSRLIKAALDGE